MNAETMIETGMPLHDAELEKSVVVSLIANPLCYPDVSGVLDADCFYDGACREIFCAIDRLYSRGEMADMVMTGNELERSGSWVKMLQLTELFVSVPVAYNLHERALMLKDFSLRRKMWAIGYRLIQGSNNKSELTEEIHAEAKKSLEGLFENMGEELLTMEDTYRSLQEDMIVRASSPGILQGTPTGFSELDANGGLNGSDLIVVGAETSQGKTSFATALSMKALEHGDHVAFYSLEMTPKQLTARIASMRSGISASRIMYQSLSMEEIRMIDTAMEGIDGSLMHFDGESTSSLDRILLSIRNMKARHDIKGAVVDYLQLVSLGERGMSREQSVAKIARDLKNLAKELDIWIIAISQLSRDKQNPVPALSRLRDSGQIEEAADNIFLIYRPRDNANYPEPYTGIETQGTAMVKIAKGRNVGTCDFICGFKSETTLFYPLQEGMIQFNAPKNYGNEDPDKELPF